MIGALLVGLPLAWINSHFNYWGKKFFRYVAYIPFILPSIIVVLSIIVFWGNNGLVNKFFIHILNLDEPPIQILYSLYGIILAHTFYNFPIISKIVGDTWGKITSYKKIGYSLGCSSFKILWKIELPLLFSAIFSASFMVFLLCLNSFSIILILGNSFNHITMDILTYQYAKVFLNFKAASVLAVFQIILSVFLLLFLYKRNIFSSPNIVNQTQSLRVFFRNKPLKTIFIYIYLIALTVFVIGPLFGVIIHSLTFLQGEESTLSLHWYFLLYKNLIHSNFGIALKNSLVVAFLCSCISGVIGISSALLTTKLYGITRRLVEFTLLMPIALSSVIFGLSWLYFQHIFSLNFPFVLLAIIIHSILFFQYWNRFLIPVLETIPKQWYYINASLGKNIFQYYIFICLPWLKKTFLSCFIITFALSIGEIDTLILISDENFTSLPLEIYRALGSYRINYASAIGVVLILIIFAVVFILDFFYKKA